MQYYYTYNNYFQQMEIYMHKCLCRLIDAKLTLIQTAFILLVYSIPIERNLSQIDIKDADYLITHIIVYTQRIQN